MWIHKQCLEKHSAMNVVVKWYLDGKAAYTYIHFKLDFTAAVGQAKIEAQLSSGLRSLKIWAALYCPRMKSFLQWQKGESMGK